MYENQDNFQKFLTVADRLTHDIVNGVYVSGKPFLSRNEICDIYKISLKTAYKVQQLLCKRGLISGNKGKAFTACTRFLTKLTENRLFGDLVSRIELSRRDLKHLTSDGISVLPYAYDLSLVGYRNNTYRPDMPYVFTKGALAVRQ